MRQILCSLLALVVIAIASISAVQAGEMKLPPNFEFADSNNLELQFFPNQSAKFWIRAKGYNGAGLDDYAPWYIEHAEVSDYTPVHLMRGFAIVSRGMSPEQLQALDISLLELDAGKPEWFPYPEKFLPAETVASLYEQVTADSTSTQVAEAATSSVDDTAPPAWTFTEEEYTVMFLRLAQAEATAEQVEHTIKKLEPGLSETQVNAKLASLREKLLQGQLTEERVKSVVAAELSGVREDVVALVQAQLGATQEVAKAARDRADVAVSVADRARGATEALAGQLATKADAGRVDDLASRIAATEAKLETDLNISDITGLEGELATLRADLDGLDLVDRQEFGRVQGHIERLQEQLNHALANLEEGQGRNRDDIAELKARVAHLEGQDVAGDSSPADKASCEGSDNCPVPTAAPATDAPTGDMASATSSGALTPLSAAVIDWLPANKVTVTGLALGLALLAFLVWRLRRRVDSVEDTANFAVQAHAPNFRLTRQGLEGLNPSDLTAGLHFTITFVSDNGSTEMIKVQVVQKKALMLQFLGLDRGNGQPPEVAVDQLGTTDVWQMVSKAVARTVPNDTAFAAA